MRISSSAARFNLNHVRTLIIDEADRMLDMGFRPALDRIVALCPADRQTLFFSATLDGEAGKAARRYTNNAAFHEHGPSERRASVDVEHHFVETTHDARIDTLLEQLNGKRDLALVFVRTKHGADKLVKKLSSQGIAAVAMHGNKTQRQRERALAEFEAFKVDTLVATDVAARGIDVAGISHVINFDPPHDSETYVHRVGRTGRAGATGIGVTLVSPDQRREVARMAGELGIEHGLAGARPSVGATGFQRGTVGGQGSGSSAGQHQGGQQHRAASSIRAAPSSTGTRSRVRTPRTGRDRARTRQVASRSAAAMRHRRPVASERRPRPWPGRVTSRAPTRGLRLRRLRAPASCRRSRVPAGTPGSAPQTPAPAESSALRRRSPAPHPTASPRHAGAPTPAGAPHS